VWGQACATKGEASVKKIMIELDLSGATVCVPEFYDHEPGFEKGATAFIPFPMGMTKQELYAQIGEKVIEFLMAT
jgi:hypothetical protein